MLTKSVKKYLLISTGTISLSFGILGIFIPILPTTPFLLLSSFCYIRSSKRLYNWLINHRIFGHLIYNYLTYRAVERNAKIVSIVFLWIALLSSILLLSNIYIRIFLLVVGIGVSIHLLTLKTLEKNFVY